MFKPYKIKPALEKYAGTHNQEHTRYMYKSISIPIISNEPALPPVWFMELITPRLPPPRLPLIYMTELPSLCLLA